MSQDINILIPDGESTWTINVIRCLKDHKNYHLHLLSKTTQTAARYSRHIKSFSTIRGTDQLLEINKMIRLLKIDWYCQLLRKCQNF